MDLADFDAGVPEPDPPTIQKRKGVQHSVGDRRLTAGHYGPCPERKCRAFVSKRDPQKHKIHALNAYAISDKVLERLGAVGVSRLFIHETDTDRVLEYTMYQWKEEARAVPEKFLMAPDDPQRFIKQADAHDWWDGHGGNLYIPRDEEVSIPDE